MLNGEVEIYPVFNTLQVNDYSKYSMAAFDEKNKKFIAVDDTSEGLFKGPKKVTGVNDIIDKNPDIIEFSQIESKVVKFNIFLK